MGENPEMGARSVPAWDEREDLDATQIRPRRSQPEEPQPAPAPKPILTLPPLDEIQPGIPVSEATGQPRRDPVMLVGIGFLYASSIVSAVALVKVWWDMIHLHTFPTSIRMVEWAKPDSWSLTAVLLAVAAAAAGATMVAAPAIAGFNAWNGYRWSRIAAIAAVALTLLSILLNDWSYAAIPLSAIGAAVLWLPPVSRYFGHWQAFRTPEERYPRDLSNVHYGPEPRYL
ncbi:hypothetical protein [Aestuariimicrobium kwangyangense]|uniref:hypothetical protein n=1 Tax=Aestuariimicrobium kwangyangense TaxID=396389 RepID=UPI0003B32FE3|nr:hypothetical protein [Aestuariimicrobium kwangyangense]